MTAATLEKSDSIIELGQRNELALAIQPRSGKTVGAVISDPETPGLIHGVRIVPLQIHADDRGFFAELARLGLGVAEAMVPGAGRRLQLSATLTYPGTIKAIHYHFEQTDLWAPLSGMLQVFLYDLRRASATFGAINTLYLGQYRPWTLLIPPGVAHGYKVIGSQPAILVYLTDRYYNPDDECRLPWDHPAIGYDWATQHK